MAARDVFVAIYKDLWDKEDCVYWELARIWLNLVAAGIHAAPWFSRKPYTDLKWYFVIAVLSTINLGLARLLALLS